MIHLINFISVHAFDRTSKFYLDKQAAKFQVTCTHTHLQIQTHTTKRRKKSVTISI